MRSEGVQPERHQSLMVAAKAIVYVSLAGADVLLVTSYNEDMETRQTPVA